MMVDTNDKNNDAPFGWGTGNGEDTPLKGPWSTLGDVPGLRCGNASVPTKRVTIQRASSGQLVPMIDGEEIAGIVSVMMGDDGCTSILTLQIAMCDVYLETERDIAAHKLN